MRGSVFAPKKTNREFAGQYVYIYIYKEEKFRDSSVLENVFIKLNLREYRWRIIFPI